MPGTPTVTIQDVGAPTPVASNVALEAYSYDYIIIGGGVFYAFSPYFMQMLC